MSMVYFSFYFILASMLTSKIKWNPLHLRIVPFGVKSDGSDLQGGDRMSDRSRILVFDEMRGRERWIWFQWWAGRNVAQKPRLMGGGRVTKREMASSIMFFLKNLLITRFTDTQVW